MDSRNRFLVKSQASEGYSTGDCHLGTVRRKLSAALAAIDGLPETTAVAEGHMARIVDAYRSLDTIARYLPKVEAWCVVKHYNDIDWKPAVWCGCTTREQAETLAMAIAAHYGKRKHFADSFVVERAACLVTEIVNHEISVQEYVASLGAP